MNSNIKSNFDSVVNLEELSPLVSGLHWFDGECCGLHANHHRFRPTTVMAEHAGSFLDQQLRFVTVQAAFQTWQNVPTAAVSFSYMGATPVGTVGQDGMNVVTFVDSSVPLGSDAIASTFTFFNFDATGTLTIQEADIALNTSAAFSTSGETGKYDMQSVLTHEAG